MCAAAMKTTSFTLKTRNIVGLAGKGRYIQTCELANRMGENDSERVVSRDAKISSHYIKM